MGHQDSHTRELKLHDAHLKLQGKRGEGHSCDIPGHVKVLLRAESKHHWDKVCINQETRFKFVVKVDPGGAQLRRLVAAVQGDTGGLGTGLG